MVRKFLLTLWNTYSFFTVYANIDRFDPLAAPVPLAERPLLDRWLAGRLAQLVTRVGDGLEDYDATNSGRAIQEFVDELSNWYVRRSRRRFWKSESDRDKLAAYHTLYECLVTLAKLLAPYTPFIAEELYQNLVRSVDPGAPESVHLCDWPVADEAAVDEAVAFDMDAARRVVELGRAARNAAAVKNSPAAGRGRRWRRPRPSAPPSSASRDIVTDELNVKELRLVADPGELLDYALKPNLKLLGPRLGKQVGAVGAALRDVDAAEFVAALRTGGSAPLVLADGEQVRLAEDEVLVETVAPEGCRVEGDAAFTVALRTTVDHGPARRRHRARAGPCRSTLAQKRRFTHRRHDQPGALGAGRAAPTLSNATRRTSGARPWPASSSSATGPGRIARPCGSRGAR